MRRDDGQPSASSRHSPVAARRKQEKDEEIERVEEELEEQQQGPRTIGMNDVCNAVAGIICCLYAIYLPVTERDRERERAQRIELESSVWRTPVAMTAAVGFVCAG